MSSQKDKYEQIIAELKKQALKDREFLENEHK